ncbi:HK97 gp10 family phage protein [Faecalimonas umbilicata]|jgi:hypothetical protein|uniref:HK97 gp10 family phage protein n=1 Tax=Faecalimonas umbilicata TaxID=1912855 RepID=UPI00205F2EAD|nr:HK97 gp10 family phage protein [Faecalimonas umbilicata]DAI81803.1 MAG TPA: putative tail component [Caudoviricetes sp.]
MSESISADKLAAEIMRQMREYTEEAKKVTRKVALKASWEAVNLLKEASPKSEGGGEYAENWSRTKDKYDITVYNKGPTYRIAHLLEKGHQLRRGGRKVGEVRAYPHIEKVEKECVEYYIEELERRL